MTQPAPPSPSQDRKFARDVARQIDRRRTRRRLTLWGGLLALVIAAAGYLRLGGGLNRLGLGGEGGDGDEQGQPLAGPRRCAIRLSASGITVNGKPTSRDEAISTCKTAPRVDIHLTGDARHDDGKELDAALKAAGAREVELHSPPTRSPDVPGTSAPAGQR
jgi:hypothetical protein